MDKLDLELASHGIDVFATEISPDFMEIHEQLVGQLSPLGQESASVQEQVAQKHANNTRLRSFLGSLPANGDPQINGYGFARSGVDETVALLKTNAWIEIGSAYNIYRPHFLIGSTMHGNKRDMLFAHAPYRSQEALSFARIQASEKVANQLIQRTDPGTSVLSPDQVAGLYSESRQKYVVTAASQPAVKIRQKYLKIAHTTVKGELCAPSKQQPVVGVAPSHHVDKLLGITDHEFASMNVLAHLSRLATYFGATKQLKASFDPTRS